jgi:hypothetical protein
LGYDKVLKQTKQEVLFDKATLSSSNLVKVKLFRDSDKLMIDTEKHEDNKHIFNLVYASVLVREDTEQYDYSRK